MSDENINLNFKADISNLTKALKDTSSMSKEEVKEAIKAIEKQGRATEKALKSNTRAIARESKAAQREIERAAQAAEKEIQRTAKAAEKAMADRNSSIKRGAATILGDQVNQVDDIIGALGAMGAPAAIAAVAVTSVAVAVVALTVAFAAGVAGAVALVRSMADIEEANAHLSGMQGFEFDPEVAEQVADANAELDLLGAIAGQLTYRLGEELLPAITDVLRVTLKLGLVSLDTWDSMSEGVGQTASALETLAVATSPGKMAFEQLSEAGEKVAGVLGVEVPESFGRLEAAVDTSFGMMLNPMGEWLDLIRDIDDATSGMDERLEQLVGTQRQSNQEMEESVAQTRAEIEAREKSKLATLAQAEARRAAAAARRAEAEATREAAQAERELGKLTRENQAEAKAAAAEAVAREAAKVATIQSLWQMAEDFRRSQLDEEVRLEEDTAARLAEIAIMAQETGLEGLVQALDAEQAVRQEHAEALGALEKRQADASAKLAADQAAREQAHRVSNLQAASSLADSMIRLWDAGNSAYLNSLDKDSNQYKKAAKQRFRIGQALAVTETLIQGSLAAAMAIAQVGPPVTPWGAAALISVAATVATSVGGIMGQKPPSFHTGGMVGPGGMTAPDEQDIRVRGDEGMLTRQGVQALGELNRGGGQGGGQVVVVQAYQHEVFDAQVQDALSNPTSSIRQAVREGQRRTGHSTRVRG